MRCVVGVIMAIEMLVMVLAGCMFVTALVLDLGESQGRIAYGLAGTSMEPYSYEGDMAIVDENKQPQIGDVIVFRAGDSEELVCHRIIGETYAESGGWITKGDAN